MLRYLRIAAAVFFASLAIGFVGLGVRSYWRCDIVRSPHWGAISVAIDSNYGALSSAIWWFQQHTKQSKWSWVSGESNPSINNPPNIGRSVRACGFELVYTNYFCGVMVPYWALTASSLAIAAAFAYRFPRRFTVRGLLLATTLIAATLGLAVYSQR